MPPLVLVTSVAAVALGAYTYDHIQSFATALANWQANGSGTVASSVWTAAAAAGGSLISLHPALTGVTAYEIRAQITLSASGGSYVFYLAAPNNALMGQTSANGAFYTVEIANPAISSAGCQATINLRSLVSGALTAPLASGAVSCRNGMEVRVILSAAHELFTFIDGVYVLYYNLPAQPVGRPGIGGYSMPAGNGFSAVSIGRLDATPPPAVSQPTVAYRALPNAVDLQWQGSLDAGIGTWGYAVLRNGVFIDMIPTASFSDTTVTAGTSILTPSSPSTITATTRRR